MPHLGYDSELWVSGPKTICCGDSKESIAERDMQGHQTKGTWKNGRQKITGGNCRVENIRPLSVVNRNAEQSFLITKKAVRAVEGQLRPRRVRAIAGFEVRPKMRGCVMRSYVRALNRNPADGIDASHAPGYHQSSAYID